MKRLKNIIDRRWVRDVKYKVGNFQLNLPSNHSLPLYQQQFKLYDKKIGMITNVLSQQYKDGFIVDIGANIGDTAAIIRTFSDLPILCIEGDSYYLKYLYENTVSMKDIDICNCFVGAENVSKNLSVERGSGTAKLIEGSDHVVELKHFEQILLEKEKDISTLRMLKIDTDGYDFPILLSISNLITKYKPNLFFEYDLSFDESAEEQANALMSLLENNEYYLIVYDNYGNFMNAISQNVSTQMGFYNAYLKSSRKYGGGVGYIDIFATADKAIFERILEEERAMVSKIKLK